ncbi:MAG: nitroreductase family protein [Actinomycetota bacterium]|uniref:Nitroreductase domain-containing protein n=1 Tax=marine metagenome TaxID=408172 RepID=A0A381Q5T1_9ZZZZ|nr:nitroreductase family protein [Actinomycetota bacterium]MEE3187226.1 nitroreductase family protein [Actinomycetota bacterium]|tara:strand:- start:421 stop:1095 length:675 start_codon:yes stop_codon:yes gene_type:complete
MDFLEVARTTFAAREFTDDPVPDDVLYRIFDTARFAPSGGNRQGWKVIAVRDPKVKQRLGELCWPAMRVAAAQMRAGEVYWQSVTTTAVDISEAASDESLPIAIPMFEHLEDVPVVCVVAVDLNVVASMDQYLDRVGVVSGASIYPMAWNALMAARNEGFGGTLTTLLASQEPAVQELLGLESYEAVAAMLTIGRPPKQLSKLSRKPVEEFVFVDHADGEPLTA